MVIYLYLCLLTGRSIPKSRTLMIKVMFTRRQDVEPKKNNRLDLRENTEFYPENPESVVRKSRVVAEKDEVVVSVGGKSQEMRVESGKPYW